MLIYTFFSLCVGMETKGVLTTESVTFEWSLSSAIMWDCFANNENISSPYFDFTTSDFTVELHPEVSELDRETCGLRVKQSTGCSATIKAFCTIDVRVQGRTIFKKMCYIIFTQESEIISLFKKDSYKELFPEDCEVLFAITLKLKDAHCWGTFQFYFIHICARVCECVFLWTKTL